MAAALPLTEHERRVLHLHDRLQHLGLELALFRAQKFGTPSPSALPSAHHDSHGLCGLTVGSFPGPACRVLLRIPGRPAAPARSQGAAGPTRRRRRGPRNRPAQAGSRPRRHACVTDRAVSCPPARTPWSAAAPLTMPQRLVASHRAARPCCHPDGRRIR